MSDTAQVKVMILGKEYYIACQKDEKDDLLDAARYLDEKMRHIRNHSQISGMDKIAVMAALNIAHELTQAQSQSHGSLEHAQALTGQVQAMQQRIDQTLAAASADE
ncbi:MAG: cell division protein ZapA [Methylococcaceae bacterium]|nr:MAG: cell division protein ZapA [Methylococcaceae bacterium]